MVENDLVVLNLFNLFCLYVMKIFFSNVFIII